MKWRFDVCNDTHTNNIIKTCQCSKSVLDKFKECYAELYNSAESSDEMVEIKDTLENIINDNLLQSEFEISKVTNVIVNQAIIKTLELSDEFAKNCMQKD